MKIFTVFSIQCIIIGRVVATFSSTQEAATDAPSDHRQDETFEEPSLACLMIVRDESESLSKNLPLWGTDFFDAFVVAVDDRTVDDTADVLDSVIPPHAPRHVYNYTFRNFGAARTQLLAESYERFPNVSHVFVMDPDWKPDAGTIRKDDLEPSEGDDAAEAYQFKIWDRSGMSTRKANWLARNRPNLSFAYYVHEDFRSPNGLPPLVAKELDWEVFEIEPEVSWHTRVGHGDGSGASRSHERYFFDLELLQMEQEDPRYTDSPHTLFYLGLVHAALLEGEEGYEPLYANPDFQLTPTMEENLDRHVMYLERLVERHMDSVLTEYVYLSLRWLSYAHQFLLLRPEEALFWYGKCVDYDSDRVDCKIELSRLHTFRGRHDEAWEWAERSLRTATPHKAWTHTYMYDCATPLQASRAALNVMAADDRARYNPYRFAVGYLSMERAKERCGTLVFEPEDIFQQLAGAYDLVYSAKNGGKSFRAGDCINAFTGGAEGDERGGKEGGKPSWNTSESDSDFRLLVSMGGDGMICSNS